ncbi:MAG TPA: phosphopantetheine-binding protein [Burkholderiales bacterium]|nr:phosphopantetheine-binding protein [Burkholderiales bacterium]
MIDSLVPDLHALFSETLNVDVPSADADLIESGLLDSLRLVELLLHIEGSLGCRVPLEEIDLDDLRSVNRIARMIAARMEPA